MRFLHVEEGYVSFALLGWLSCALQMVDYRLLAKLSPEEVHC
jgi:hypothetical protein